MSLPISQVPQADILSKVITTVEAVYIGFTTDQQIADYVDFTATQGKYYRLAAEILGLLKTLDDNAILTPAGEDLIILDNENRLKKIRTILKGNALFKAIINHIESEDGGRSRSEIVKFLSEIIEANEATIIRTSNIVISWLVDSSLLRLDIRELADGDKETVYKINEELDSNDFIEPSDFIDSIYPATYSNEELDIKENHIQVISLIRKKDQGKIVVPEFQRNQVWKQQQKSRFIESLILNIPVPPFYISQDLDGGMIIVDGLQRSTAIFEFLSDSYKLAGLEALPYLNGLSYKDLDPTLRARIEDRELLLYILKPTVPMSIVYDIFNRINSNGTPLTRQEIRNCIYIGKATRLLAKLSESEIFKKATDNGIPSLRMKDREAILRFFAFSNPNALTEYKGDLDDFLGKAMRRINRMSEEDIKTLEKRFLKAMKLTFNFFGRNNFRLPTAYSRGRLNVALFEVVSVFFDQMEEVDLIAQRNFIVNKYYNELLTDDEFRDSVRVSTNNERNVKTRFEKVFKILSPQ